MRSHTSAVLSVLLFVLATTQYCFAFFTINPFASFTTSNVQQVPKAWRFVRFQV